MALKALMDAFEKSLLRLQEAHSRARAGREDNDCHFFRDSAIQSFEFTVEIFWKTMKAICGRKGCA